MGCDEPPARRGAGVAARAAHRGDPAAKFGITSSKSVSLLAAPAFAAAVQEREVIGTIPAKRLVLLVAEVPVEPGSALADHTVDAAQRGGEVRVIAVTAGEYRNAVWVPHPDRELRAGEQLLVVASRTGLGRMVGQSAGCPDEAPAPRPAQPRVSGSRQGPLR